MADDVTSNILEVQAEFRQLVQGFDFLRTGKDQSLGRDLAVAAAEGIFERSAIEGMDATGSPMKPNNPAYAARKLKDHDVSKPGILTGQTLSLASLLGSPTIDADEVTMNYGTGTQPTAYATRGTITVDEPTDIEKAELLTKQGRPFYELDEGIADDLRGIAGESLEEYIEGYQ